MFNPSSIEAGSIAYIEIRLDDGVNQTTGETVPVSVRRRSDNFYYKGGDVEDPGNWQAAYTSVNMTDLTNGSDPDVKARYQLAFTTLAAADQYVWFVEHLVVATNITFRLTGEIVAEPAVYDANYEFRADSSNSRDEHPVRFLKNLVPIVNSALTLSPTLTVKRRDAAGMTTIINAKAMSDDGAGGWIYRATGAERCPAGSTYEATITATIGGVLRTFQFLFGRDK